MHNPKGIIGGIGLIAVGLVGGGRLLLNPEEVMLAGSAGSARSQGLATILQSLAQTIGVYPTIFVLMGGLTLVGAITLLGSIGDDTD